MTAKESYVKLLGTGIDAGFMHFSVIENGRICGDRLFVRFTTIPSPAGYSFACAAGLTNERGAKRIYNKRRLWLYNGYAP